MKLWIPTVIFLATLAASFAATAPPAKKKPAAKSTTKSGTAKRSAGKRKGKSTGRASSGSPTSRQLTPTPERYTEIQQALASKGYLKSEPNGVWDSQSADAMRRFQSDKKLDPSGKINSTSLIGLGLGPKTTSNPAAAPAAIEPPAPIVESPPPAQP